MSHIAEIFARSESFRFSLLPGIEKVWIREEGSIKVSRRIFLSHSAEKLHLVGESCGVSQISGIEQIYSSEGYVNNLLKFFLSHSTEKFHR